MSTVDSPLTAPQVTLAPEVRPFARQNGLEPALDHMLQATPTLYAGVRRIDVTVETDRELPDDTYIVLEVEVPEDEVPDYVAGVHRWSAELYRVCPASQVTMFRLTLLRG